MDQPGLDAARHRQALHGLRRINWWSRTASSVWQALRSVAIRRRLDNLRVLDLACGGGDVSLSLLQRARRDGVPLTLHGWDKSPTAVTYAEQQAKRRRLSGVRFFQRDVLRDAIDETYDVVTCTLFLHHLQIDDARRLLRKMRSAARHAVVVDDLRRTRSGYVLAWLGTRVLSGSPIVHTDGPLSVRAAFRCDEVRALSESAGLDGAAIRPHWPQRFLLTWERR